MNKSMFQLFYKGKHFTLPSYLKQEKTQRISALVLTFITLSIFGFFAISPTLSTIAALQKELADSKDVDLKLQQKINNLISLEKQYNTIKSDIPYILDAIPSSPTVPLVIAQMQAIALQTNVTLANLQSAQVELTNPQSNKENAPSFSLSVTASGDYKQIASFIGKLTSLSRIVSIDTVSISQTAKSGTQLSLRARAYFKS